MRREKLVHPLNEVTLQLVLILQSELLHPRLRSRARLPLVLEHFIPSDMNELTRKKRQCFREHVLQEHERRLVDIEDIFIDAPDCAYFYFLTGIAQLRIGGNSCLS